MKDFDPNVVSRKFSEAPEEIRLFLANPYTKQQLLDVARAFGAHIDQLEGYHNQIYLFLIGLLSPEEFEGELAEKLDLNTERLSQIIKILNNEFFTPLRLMYEDDEDGVYKKPENEVSVKKPNMLEKKLKQSVLSNTEEKNYSLKKTPSSNHDPYQEPID